MGRLQQTMTPLRLRERISPLGGRGLVQIFGTAGLGLRGLEAGKLSLQPICRFGCMRVRFRLGKARIEVTVVLLTAAPGLKVTDLGWPCYYRLLTTVITSVVTLMGLITTDRIPVFPEGRWWE